MSGKLIAPLIWAICCLLFVCSACMVFIFHLFTYEHFVTAVLQGMNRADLEPVVRTRYFSFEKFSLLKNISLLLSPLSVGLLITFVRYRRSVNDYLNKNSQVVWQLFIKAWRSLTDNTLATRICLIAMLLIILIRSIFYAGTFYIQHDEAWNYTFFLQHNALYSLFVYNNYPLHNLVSEVFLALLPDNTFTLRLPSIIVGLMCCLLVFISFKHLTGSELVGLCTMALFASLPITVFYMLYARGVIMEIFFAILIIFLLWHYERKGFSLNKMLLLSLLNALGVLAMITHLYFIAFSAISFGLTVFINRSIKWKSLVQYTFISSGLGLLVLLPMAAGSGLSPAINAGKANSNYLVLHGLPYHCYADFSTGHIFGFYVLIVLNIVLLFRKTAVNSRLLIINNFVLLMAPILAGLVTNAWLPERALAFLCIPALTTFALLSSWLIDKKTLIILMSIVLCVALNIKVYDHSKLNWSKEKDRAVYRLATILQKNNMHGIYDESRQFAYFIAGIQYYFAIQHQTIRYHTTDPASNRYTAVRPADADCLVSGQAKLPLPLLFSFEEVYVYSLQ